MAFRRATFFRCARGRLGQIGTMTATEFCRASGLLSHFGVVTSSIIGLTGKDAADKENFRRFKFIYGSARIVSQIQFEWQ